MQKHHRLNLIERLQQLPDPRVQGRCDHDLVDVLVIALCCLLCGGEGFNDMEEFGEGKRDWFRTFSPLHSGIPKHDTFSGSLTNLAQVTILVDYLRVKTFPGPAPSTMVIEWTSPNVVLQFATQLEAPPAFTQWQDLPNVESGDLVHVSGPGRYYRLKR
jgi:hypothetical protein